MSSKYLIGQSILFLVLLFGVLLSFNTNAQDMAKLIEANHKKFVPQGNGPFPVIIAMPGCSGVSLQGPKTDIGRPNNEDDVLFRRHYPHSAKKLQDEGYLVVLVDYLSAENVINTCNGEIPHDKVAAYVEASIRFVKSIAEADTTKISVMGSSYGGVGVLTWLSNLNRNPDGVNSVIAIYPGCGTLKGWTSTIPVLMLLGELDDIAPPGQCTLMVNDLPQQTKVRVKIYPNARHGFDMTEGPEILAIDHGKTVGKNQQAGNEAWKEILSFLHEEK